MERGQGLTRPSLFYLPSNSMEGKGAWIELGDYFDVRWEDLFTRLLGRKLEEPKPTTLL